MATCLFLFVSLSFCSFSVHQSTKLIQKQWFSVYFVMAFCFINITTVVVLGSILTRGNTMSIKLALFFCRCHFLKCNEITEKQIWKERSLGDYVVQGQIIPVKTIPVKCLYNLHLKTSNNGHSTIFPDNLLRFLTTLIKFFLISNLHFPCCNLRLLFLVLSHVDRENNQSPSSL